MLRSEGVPECASDSDELLTAALAHVSTHGFSIDAIVKAAASSAAFAAVADPFAIDQLFPSPPSRHLLGGHNAAGRIGPTKALLQRWLEEKQYDLRAVVNSGEVFTEVQGLHRRLQMNEEVISYLAEVHCRRLH